jgi:hypothetical protein
MRIADTIRVVIVQRGASMKRAVIAIAVWAAAGAAWAAEEREVQVKERTHGCRTPEETYRFWSLARRDKDAAARYSNEKGCRIFAAGETVAIVEPLPTNAMNGVRAKGDKVVYFLPAADAR